MNTHSSDLPTIDISIECEAWPPEEKLRSLLEKAIGVTRTVAGLDWPQDAELSLVFTDDASMALINGQWRDKPVPTNVLSFPGSDIVVGEAAELLIGDLVFAHGTVCREAAEQEKTFDDHLIHLAVHGFLHLFGYDHLSDGEAEQMEAVEIAVLERLGIANPYA